MKGYLLDDGLVVLLLDFVELVGVVGFGVRFILLLLVLLGGRSVQVVHDLENRVVLPRQEGHLVHHVRDQWVDAV